MNLLAKKSTYNLLKGLGFLFLILYFYIYRDFSFSFLWALLYILIALLVSNIVVWLDLDRRFPILNKYLFLQTKVASNEDEYVKVVGNYLLSMFKGWSFLHTPGEDGFICVPLLLLGINPITALLGGFIFGFLHLGRFTYFECLMKFIIYSFACYFVLPHGVLTVIAGHMALNSIVWISTVLMLKNQN